MGAAAAPILIGSAMGAATNRKNPMQGALLGGVLGGAGSAFAGFGNMASTTANTAGATANTAANTAVNTAANTAIPSTAAFINPAGVNAGTNAAMTSVAPAGIFANPAGYTASTNVANQVALTPGTYGPGGNLAQASSLNAAPINTVAQNTASVNRLGTGERFQLGDIGQYAQNNPVLTQMAYMTARDLLSNQEPQLQSPGLMRGNQIQASAPQYQLGSPKVSLI
jgi:hypothetical protein